MSDMKSERHLEHEGRNHIHLEEHGHHHHWDSDAPVGRLFVTMALNFIITFVEVIGSIVSGSLSLLSDALHNFSDGVSIIISYVAIRLGKLPNTSKYTFGLKRAEILAAVLNAGTLIVISFYLFKESYERLIDPQPVSGVIMLIVASVGLVANIIGTLLLKKNSKDNLNIRSAYLHLLSDAVSSAAVIMGGIAIYYFDCYWLDPVLTILISLYILKESIEIVKEAVEVLLMGTPQSVSIENIQKEIEAVSQVKNIHHVHIWRLNDRRVHFEAHIDVEDMRISESSAVVDQIEEILIHNHGITHITLQLECEKCVSKKLV